MPVTRNRKLTAGDASSAAAAPLAPAPGAGPGAVDEGPEKSSASEPKKHSSNKRCKSAGTVPKSDAATTPPLKERRKRRKAQQAATGRPATAISVNHGEPRSASRKLQRAAAAKKAGAGAGRLRKAAPLAPACCTEDLPDELLLLIFAELQLHRCVAAQGAVAERVCAVGPH